MEIDFGIIVFRIETDGKIVRGYYKNFVTQERLMFEQVSTHAISWKSSNLNKQPEPPPNWLATFVRKALNIPIVENAISDSVTV